MPKLTPEEMKGVIAAFKSKFTTGFYHGSPSPNIKAFSNEVDRNPNFLSPLEQEKEQLGPRGFTSLTTEPKFANDYAEAKRGTIYPVSANLGKHFDPRLPENYELFHKYWKSSPDTFPNAIAPTHMIPKYFREGDWGIMEDPGFIQHLKDKGYNSMTMVENGRANVGIFDPKDIRGKFAKYNPEDAESPDFMKAAGGSVQAYAPGGQVLSKFAHGQIPKVAQALEDYLKGNISQEERIRILNEHLPIRKWTDLPPDYTDEQIRNALMANKQAKALVDVPAGMQVGNRLDIPAYTQHGVYVDTTHDAAGKPISYNRTGHLTDVQFSSKPNQAVRVGLGTKEQALTPLGAEIGSAKSPFALIKGTNVGTSDEEVRRMMAEMMQDPAYTQIGMDPRRHSQFYDKSTGLPVWSAEEKLQSGPLIIAPKQGLETTSWDDPRLNLSDFEGKKYATGGSVMKKALEFAKSVPFVHYSTKPNLTYLEPAMYGTGIKGAEAARLKDAPDIKPRSYFYVDKGEATQRPEQGLGSFKYQGTAQDIYPLHEDPMGFSAMAKQKALDPYMMQFGREVVDTPTHLNELERLIKGAGYKGYANDDVGLLFHPTEVQKVD